jgi:hypothetical protein
MGGDDVLGRPLGGACVPTQLLLADLKEASEDASLPKASHYSSERRRERNTAGIPSSPHVFLDRLKKKEKNLDLFSSST